MRNFLFTLIIFLVGCGIPNEKDISNNIDQGIKKIEASSFNESWDYAKDVEDYLHLIHYKYDKKDLKKMDKHLTNLEHSLVVMDKKESEKEWKKVRKTWDGMKNNE